MRLTKLQQTKDAEMGLEMALHDKDRTELIWLCEHWDFLSMFDPMRQNLLDPYADFPVSEGMLKVILNKIEIEMAECRMPIRPIPPQLDGRAESNLGLSDYFCDGEPVDWVEALPNYRVLIARLLDRARGGDLICSWSS